MWNMNSFDERKKKKKRNQIESKTLNEQHVFRLGRQKATLELNSLHQYWEQKFCSKLHKIIKFNSFHGRWCFLMLFLLVFEWVFLGVPTSFSRFGFFYSFCSSSKVFINNYFVYAVCLLEILFLFHLFWCFEN